jgi:ABC-type Fe3+/spermidine/putrescine transport system ATPase subunit
VLRASDAPALLVTHDFTEAAQLGDRVGVIDSGRIVQEGTASELAAAPHSAFVADFTGAVVMTGNARRAADGLTHVDLDGGGEVVSTDVAEGPVAVSLYPWEIAIEPAGEQPHGSAQNRLRVEVVSTTTVGNRETLRVSRSALRGLDLAVLRRSRGHEPAEQPCRRRGDLLHRLVESLGVRL